MLKKALSIFISVLMVISLLPVLAFADTYTNPTIYADNATSTAGNTVSIAVYVANNPGVWGMDVIVSYDRAIMTLSKVTNGEIFDSS
ncbi:MAG: cohesin domain-containing protein, partial [Eubacteriales bacterium]|nr:cohesin domain-containing protein [Eubacteriales bacterium]